jgi:hypothetical protein
VNAVVVQSWDEFLSGEPGVVFEARDITDPENPHPIWHTKPPCGHPGVLVPPESPNEDGGFHTVTVSEDGLVTVDPSIWCQAGGENHDEPCWHGFLKNGVWESV